MQTFSQTLVASQVWPLIIAGRYFRILTAPYPLNVTFFNMGRVTYQAESVDAGFYALPEGGFDRVEVVSSSGPQVVKLAISSGEGGYDMAGLVVSGSVEVTNDAGNPLPVSIASGVELEFKNDSGNPLPCVLNATSIVREADAATLANPAPVSVGVAATLLVSAAAARQRVVFFNGGTDTVYLGSAAVTVANGAIAIAPGQTYFEDRAAAAAWYGISATAAQSVRIQTVS